MLSVDEQDFKALLALTSNLQLTVENSLNEIKKLNEKIALMKEETEKKAENFKLASVDSPPTKQKKSPQAKTSPQASYGGCRVSKRRKRLNDPRMLANGAPPFKKPRVPVSAVFAREKNPGILKLRPIWINDRQPQPQPLPQPKSQAKPVARSRVMELAKKYNQKKKRTSVGSNRARAMLLKAAAVRPKKARPGLQTLTSMMKTDSTKVPSKKPVGAKGLKFKTSVVKERKSSVEPQKSTENVTTGSKIERLFKSEKLANATVKDLKAFLKSKKTKVSGRKSDLIKRVKKLLQSDAQ